ncbi:mandelate racemase/muconate lactonizing enzyme family protein [Thermomicrobium sp. 4228-Ro]|uniref:mandelate racemase/muconate lactonizing enzyme family protein n=1 Tax=Thermomicrobium sp. 4228-Ro TaxID=2993937 RepID=UPI0022490C6A|nr:mandelate racemase/muconate lactonizing enzyme family protein [Thermomicrobium sp. 4228-Ro]MCX2728409.1 mandelate racemase/muconate lactonizing enzyme family protein [Thermomicrobium sp. 4228-Ro]
MRIVDVKTYVLGTAWRNLTFVEVHTDEGITGVGEARMLNHTDALLGYLAEAVPNHVLGSDPFRIEDLVFRMMRNDYARPDYVMMSGIAAIEIACWDIMGKALGLPVYQLLGGAVRDRIKAYANGWYTVERTPEEFAEAARRAVARGYRALKLDPFGAGYYELELDEKRRAVALVEAVREAVGPDVEILIEMHGRFNPATAIEMARLLEPYRPGWIEEPVPPHNLAALKKVAEQVTIPVATGERIHTRYDFRELFELQAADVIQPDITHLGGLLETKKLAAWADAYYILVAPHNVCGPVGTAANLHLAACTTNFKIQEHFNDFAEEFVKAAAPGLPEVVDGYFPLPSGSGLGVQLDHTVLEQYPRRRIFFNLFAEDWHRRQVERA